MAARARSGFEVAGIVVKPDSPEAKRRAGRLAIWLEGRGLEVLAEPSWAGQTPRAVVERAEMMRRADLVVALGGDGTLLSVARLSRRGSAAVVGINHGGFGFLTVSDSGGLYATMRRILAGDFTLEQRTMLAVVVKRRGRVVARSQALNDAVVTRAAFFRTSRMLALEAEVDGTRLTEYLGDGLIVATPTGSTAYSLSAGGPVVDPAVGAILVTPISPHTLNSRPLVLPERATVRIRVAASGDAVLTLDGQEAIELSGRDSVELSRSPNRAAVVSPAGAAYFEILRDKMGWGGKRHA